MLKTGKTNGKHLIYFWEYGPEVSTWLRKSWTMREDESLYIHNDLFFMDQIKPNSSSLICRGRRLGFFLLKKGNPCPMNAALIFIN
jgi:hypothetical protein